MYCNKGLVFLEKQEDLFNFATLKSEEALFTDLENEKDLNYATKSLQEPFSFSQRGEIS